MDIQHIILGVINSGPMTGYEIKQFFDQSLTFFSGVSFGSIYPTLKKLEKNGLVTKRIEVQDGRPNRKIYSITESGLNDFREALLTPVKPTKIKHDFLTRLFFFGDVTPENRMRIFAEYLHELQVKLSVFEEVASFVADAADPFQKQCFRFGVRKLKQEIQGLNQIKNQIDEKKDG